MTNLTVLNIFSELVNDNDNKFLPHKLKYDRIKTKTSDTSRFVPNYNEEGYSFKNLVFNTKRANLSFMIKIEGTVNIEPLYNLPENFPTFIFKTFTFIRDGELHTPVIPVSLTAKSKENLKDFIITTDNQDYLNLYGLPISNKSHECNPFEMTINQYGLLKLQAKNKVLNTLNSIYCPKEKTTNNLLQQYGAEATEYLKSLGITDNGYSNYKLHDKEGKEYSYTEFEVKIKSSVLPTLEKLLEKTQSKELKIAKAEMELKLLKDSSNTEDLLKIKSLEREIKKLSKDTYAVNLNVAEGLMYEAYQKYIELYEAKDFTKIKEITNQIQEKIKAYQKAIAQTNFHVLVNNIEFDKCQAITIDNYNLEIEFSRKEVTEKV